MTDGDALFDTWLKNMGNMVNALVLADWLEDTICSDAATIIKLVELNCHSATVPTILRQYHKGNEGHNREEAIRLVAVYGDQISILAPTATGFLRQYGWLPAEERARLEAEKKKKEEKEVLHKIKRWQHR